MFWKKQIINDYALFQVLELNLKFHKLSQILWQTYWIFSSKIRDDK